MSLSLQKVDANNANDLKTFNDHLVNFSYADGYNPTQRDASIFAGFSSAPDAKYPNIARWYKHIGSFNENERKGWSGAATASTAKAASPAGDEDFDLFGEDSEDDAEKERITQERLKAYAEKKSKKPGPIAKSNVIYDVKPWDDTIDIKEIEQHVRSIETDGLVWGTSKVLPIAYGVNKLQICCVIEDEKVSTDWLEEQITSNEDLIQSVD
uniref:Elongation factor 1-beta n=1 Tax=Acrobeloides nanus TaxID=290746 RepID=A0A914CQF6_9BILA